jgi:inosose dehydratase
MPVIHLGSAPDSWGVWFRDDPHQPPWERFLDELAMAGYRWVELGPHGYLPTDPARLRDEMARRGLGVSGGTVAGALHRASAWADVIARAREVGALVSAVGARHLVFLPEMYRDLRGALVSAPTLEREEWGRLVTGASTLGRILAEEYGVTLAFHPHADSHIATQVQIAHLLEDTDASAVSLCLDTGHVAYCGGDSLDLIEAYPDRIAYVHLKQADEVILRQVRSCQLGFAEAVRRGVMCEPPGGTPAFEPVLAALSALGTDLFAIVEQDMYPCDPGAPLPIAARTLAYLRRIGQGLDPRPPREA